jgi:hypothetical protein
MIEVRPFDTLGGADHGWLKAKHHFSFARYVDPNRMGHGALRVWNDDEIALNTGFGQVSPRVAEWLAAEQDAGLGEAATYDAFAARVEANRQRLRDLLGTRKAEGRRLAGYGAPAKGNTLLNYCGIGPDTMRYLADRNSLKHGLYSPGMHIPVVPAETVLEDQPDDLLILAWNFSEEIMQQQQEYRRRGGVFILPIPEPRIVG